MEKSAWLMPEQFGVSMEYFIAIVWGSRKSRRLRASATTMAERCRPGKIHVVRIIDGNRFTRLASKRINRVTLPSSRPFRVVVDPKRFKIPRRHHVLRVNADAKFVDHLKCRWIDHPNVVGASIGDVDAREMFGNSAELIGPCFAVEIVGSTTGGMPGRVWMVRVAELPACPPP